MGPFVWQGTICVAGGWNGAICVAGDHLCGRGAFVWQEGGMGPFVWQGWAFLCVCVCVWGGGGGGGRRLAERSNCPINVGSRFTLVLRDTPAAACLL